MEVEAMDDEELLVRLIGSSADQGARL